MKKSSTPVPFLSGEFQRTADQIFRFGIGEDGRAEQFHLIFRGVGIGVQLLPEDGLLHVVPDGAARLAFALGFGFGIPGFQLRPGRTVGAEPNPALRQQPFIGLAFRPPAPAGGRQIFDSRVGLTMG